MKSKKGRSIKRSADEALLLRKLQAGLKKQSMKIEQDLAAIKQLSNQLEKMIHE